MAKPDTERVGEKKEGWSSEYKPVKDPSLCLVGRKSQNREIGRREKIIESSRRCCCQDALIEGLPCDEAEKEKDPYGDPSP